MRCEQDTAGSRGWYDDIDKNLLPITCTRQADIYALRDWLRSVPEDRKALLRPVAETLAMLDGKAFFGLDTGARVEWWEQYLPEAHALFEANGGMAGQAGRASFAGGEDGAGRVPAGDMPRWAPRLFGAGLALLALGILAAGLGWAEGLHALLTAGGVMAVAGAGGLAWALRGAAGPA